MRRPALLQVRFLLLALGIGVGVAQTLLAWDRGAAPTEVLAPALYVPVFAGAIFFGVAGGLAAAGVASLAYLLVLVDQSEVFGMRLFVGLLLNRVATYFAYGLLVAMGARYLEGRLHKLELYDQIDDETELFNSAFFLEDSDLEMSRSGRYSTIFSVAEMRLENGVFADVRRSRRRRIHRELGRLLRQAVRTVDRPARVRMTDRDRYLVILPETGRQGSTILADRLEEATRQFLADQRLAVNGSLSGRALTFPDDSEAIEDLRREVADADAERRTLAAPGQRGRR